MAKKKKQHYVPKFYLKLFTKSNKLCPYIINKKELMDPVPYYDQCCKNYFYQIDKNNRTEIEDILGKLEDNLAPVIRDICNGTQISDQLESKLKQFIVLQLLRTPKHFNDFTNSLDKLFKGITNNRKAFQMLNVFEQTLQCIEDLETAVISNSNDLIITSDNPVIIYNQFFSDSITINHTGLLEKGIVILLPLSSKKIAVLYDPTTYKINNSISSEDFLYMNLLTFLNADNLVFLHPNCPSDILKIFDNYKKIYHSKRYPTIEINISQYKKRILVQNDGFNFNYKFTFLRELINPLDYDFDLYHNRNR